ncbi:MAG: hypothetical protein QG656_2462 [Candidatus Hydrogenedentes bacterium]|nr:hypothetical protein [Candidatus Hydrogenedentota bacterium]
MLPIVVPDEFRIIAHRGASAYAPENTFAAFDLARKMGASEVEIDVQLATDGTIVLCHDRTLDRYGHGARVVEEMTSAELLALDMGSWFSPYLYASERAVTLDALFDRYGDAFTYHVEIKGAHADLPATVNRAIMGRGLADRCIVTSFSYDQLARLKASNPDLRRAWLVKQADPATFDAAQALGVFQWCPAADAVNAALVEQARKVATEVRAWGVKGEPEAVVALIQKVVASGCDGMTINWPDWVIHRSDVRSVKTR